MEKRNRIPRKLKKKQRQYKRFTSDTLRRIARLNGLNPGTKWRGVKYTKYSESAARIAQFEADRQAFHNANGFGGLRRFWAQFLANPVSIESGFGGIPVLKIPADSVSESRVFPTLGWGDFPSRDER